jgi:hypothetical protein
LPTTASEFDAMCPFVRGPNVDELHRMYQSAIETYKRIVEERKAHGEYPAS